MRQQKVTEIFDYHPHKTDNTLKTAFLQDDQVYVLWKKLRRKQKNF